MNSGNVDGRIVGDDYGEFVVKTGLPDKSGLSTTMPTHERIVQEYPAILEGLRKSIEDANPDSYAESMRTLVETMSSEISIQFLGDSERINSLRAWQQKLPPLDRILMAKLKSGQDIVTKSDTRTGANGGGQPFGTGSFQFDASERTHAGEVADGVINWIKARSDGFITAKPVEGIPSPEWVNPSVIQVESTFLGFRPDTATE